MQRRLKAAPVDRLIAHEVTALSGVSFHLCIAQTDPPFIARCINGLSARQRERTPRRRALFVRLCNGDDNCAPLSQRIFIDEQLIVRQADGQVFFNSAARSHATLLRHSWASLR